MDELRTLIRDADREIAFRNATTAQELSAGRLGIVADLAKRPVCGCDLDTLRAVYGLDFTSELTVSGLVYAAFCYAHAEAGSVKPLRTMPSALRIRTLLSIEGLRIPWQMRPHEFPEYREFLARAARLPVDQIDAAFLSRLTGRVPQVCARWIRDPERYQLKGPSAQWLGFLRWLLESRAPSERLGLLRSVMEVVATEVHMRAQHGADTEEEVEEGAQQRKAKAKGAQRKAKGAE